MFNKCLIAGLGLMGGSLALAMKEAGLGKQFFGLDTDPDHCKRALSYKMVEKILSNDGPLPEFDFIALCTPVAALEGIVKRLPKNLPEQTIIIDVASVKQSAIKAVNHHLTEKTRRQYVPCHPIAGAADYGPDAATPELYRGKAVIITPHPEMLESSHDRVKGLWRLLGAGTRMMEPEKHDRVYAYVSHLPQLLAYAFMLAYGDTLQPKGLDKFLRIGGSNPQLWGGIFMANRHEVLLALDDFQLEMRRHASYSAYGQMIAALEAICVDYKNYEGQGYRDFTTKLHYSIENTLPQSPLPLHHEIATFHELLRLGDPERLVSALRRAKTMHTRCFG